MSINITPPTEGRVTLELSWDDAEVLSRLVGLVTGGNLKEFSLTLYEFVQQMNEHVGRNTQNEARKFVAKTAGPNQAVYLYENNPF